MSKPEGPSTPPSRDSADPNYDAEATIPRGLSAWFGGPNVKIGPRIAPQIIPVVPVTGSSSDLSSEAILNKQIESEANAAIQYRTCSWQKTAALLFSEYICLVSCPTPPVPEPRVARRFIGKLEWPTGSRSRNFGQLDRSNI